MPKKIFKNSLGRQTQLYALELVAVDQAALERLPQGLPEKSSLDGISFNQIENRSEGAGTFEPLRRLHIVISQVRKVQHKNTGNSAVPPKVGRDGHVQLGGVKIGEFIESQGRLVAVDSFGHLVPIPRPQRPLHQVRMFLLSHRMGRRSKVATPFTMTSWHNTILQLKRMLYACRR